MRFVALLVLGLAIGSFAQEKPQPASSTQPLAGTLMNALYPDGTRVLRHESIVNATPAQVWERFTTKSGIESWMVPLAEIEFRVGGQLKTTYSKEQGIGGPGTIVHTLIAYDPQRMLTFRLDKAPDSSPAHIAGMVGSWWTLYLEPLGPRQTRVSISQSGYKDGAQWDQAVAHFDRGNAWTLQQLVKAFAQPASAVTDVPSLHQIGPFEMIVPATAEQAFSAVASEEGLSKWAAPAAKVDLTVGGAYEIWFAPHNPPGRRGMENTKVLSYVPNEMIAYTGGYTCSWMMENQQRPWGVYRIWPVDDKHVKVTYIALGMAAGKECADRFAMFNQIMPRELKRLEDLLSGRPTHNRHLAADPRTEPKSIEHDNQGVKK